MVGSEIKVANASKESSLVGMEVVRDGESGRTRKSKDYWHDT